ncbi:hypothetical protein G9F32_03335 [Acinetobacter sp. 194]|nr:hypothetical protein [Acinetobacter shaoyimingii]NHB57067.1 hypothetical protein [Acinetobacter shaoyimingii]
MTCLYCLSYTGVWAKIPEHAFWNADRTLAVASEKKGKRTNLMLYIHRLSHLREIDISQVEGMNLGKLGLGRREYYDRIETTPIAWVQRNDGKFQVDIQTQVWKNGKRQTVKEYVVFDANGMVYWR